MRQAPSVIAILALSACAALQRQDASKVEIEIAAKRSLTKREAWAAKAQLSLNARRDAYDGTWRVTASALDPRHTECGCIPLVPGTSRELLFSRSGALMSCIPIP